LNQLLQRFWETEELPNKTWKTEEILCEKHFKKHTVRDDAGHYIVRLPGHKGQGHLGESYEQARRQFHQLERQFQEHPYLHQGYSEFMQKYEDLGHMNQINQDASSAEERYYHIMRFSRVPAVQHALKLFLMAHVVQVTDCL